MTYFFIYYFLSLNFTKFSFYFVSLQTKIVSVVSHISLLILGGNVKVVAQGLQQHNLRLLD